MAQLLIMLTKNCKNEPNVFRGGQIFAKLYISLYKHAQLLRNILLL